MKNLSSTFKRRLFASVLPVASAIIAAAALATPAAASTVIVNKCDPVTDGDAQGCLFKGNINGEADPLHKNGYNNAEAAYNALPFPDITLNYITKSDDNNFGKFGTFTGANANSGTFNLPGWTLQYYAVKAGNNFELFEYIGSNNWVTPDKNGMSHIAFFGIQSAVPEPATWAMMLFGFGGMGAALRRRRRATTGMPQFA